MVVKRGKPEAIISKLRPGEALQAQGIADADAVRQIGVTQNADYRRREQYGGMNRDQLKRLKAREPRPSTLAGYAPEPRWHSPTDVETSPVLAVRALWRQGEPGSPSAAASGLSL